MDVSTIYVNSSNLNNFIGTTVRLVGKVLKVNDNLAMIESTDGGQITVTMNKVCEHVFVYALSYMLNKESDYNQSKYIEIIGKVQSEIALQEYTSIPLGDDLGEISGFLRPGLTI